MRTILLLVVFGLITLRVQAQSQFDTWGYRFPKAAFKVSLVMPEISLETASKKGSTFLLGVGSSAAFYRGELSPRPYIYAQYRYYFKTPQYKWLNDGTRAEGFYVLGGLYAYQSRVEVESGSFILGGGGGFQWNMGRYFFTDVFVCPGAAVLSNGERIQFGAALTAGVKLGIELTVFESNN